MSTKDAQDNGDVVRKISDSVDIEQQGRPIALDPGLPKSLGAGVSAHQTEKQIHLYSQYLTSVTSPHWHWVHSARH